MVALSCEEQPLWHNGYHTMTVCFRTIGTYYANSYIYDHEEGYINLHATVLEHRVLLREGKR